MKEREGGLSFALLSLLVFSLFDFQARSFARSCKLQVALQVVVSCCLVQAVQCRIILSIEV